MNKLNIELKALVRPSSVPLTEVQQCCVRNYESFFDNLPTISQLLPPLEMPKDYADFRDEDMRAVWKGEPRCIVTAIHNQVDKSHILGRGPMKKPEERKIYSSIFNMAPIHRSVHAGPVRDTPDFRRFLLNRVRQEVMQAVGQGRYTLTDIDYAFLKIADQSLHAHE